jgi:hypothetical protein
MIPCLYDKKQHEIIPGGDIIAWCRREAPASEKARLFLYRHRLLGTFVIARWALDRAMGIFTDFLNIGNSLSDFDRRKAGEFLRRMYKPLTAKSISRVIGQANRDFDSAQQDEAEETQERKKEMI